MTIEVSKRWFLVVIVLLFALPTIEMLAYGAFLNITGLHWVNLGYWAFFFINLLIGCFIPHLPLHWKVKKEH